MVSLGFKGVFDEASLLYFDARTKRPAILNSMRSEEGNGFGNLLQYNKIIIILGAIQMGVVDWRMSIDYDVVGELELPN